MNLSIMDWYEYHAWANLRVITHLQGLPESESIFQCSVQNVFSSIALTCGHLYAVDRLWLDRTQGTRTGAVVAEKFDSLDVAKQAFESLHQTYRAWLATDDVQASQVITYQNSKGVSFENTLEDIIIHLVNHGTYHRGNIASMFRQLGYEGIATDYIVYARERI